MGATTSRMEQHEAAELAALMKLQREYVLAKSDQVNFANPTGSEEEEDAGSEMDDEDENKEEYEHVGEDQDIGFQAYVPKTLNLPGAGKHPSPAVENGTLSTVSPPEITYELAIAKHRPEIIHKCRLSALQLEFVALASQRHESRLASGSRKGFFLGDGAGMGKGRQIAGLILENFLKGRRKHIWVSTSHDLKEDAMRDLSDLAGVTIEYNQSTEMRVLSLPSSASAQIEADCGVLFTTYSMLSKGYSDKSRDNGSLMRIAQILDWLNSDEEEFDGCLIFDEAHRAKNLVAENGNSATETAAGRAVFDIQRALPHARIVYSSATGVTEPHHYAYMTRLGLWGPSAPHPIADPESDEQSAVAVRAFIKRVKDRGVGAMELCALHLKQEGALLNRTLSYDGVQFDIVEATLTDEQKNVYDESARLWQLIYTRSEQKLANMMNHAWATAGLGTPDTKAFSKARKMSHSAIWSGHQRFFRSLITSFKVPTLVQQAREALAQGKCVVIGLQSTGEAHTQRAMNAKMEDNDVSDDDNELADNADFMAGSDNMLSAPQETLKFVVSKVWEDEIKANRDRRLKEIAVRKEIDKFKSEKLFDDESDDELLFSKSKAEPKAQAVPEPISTEDEEDNDDSIMDCCSSDSEDDEPVTKKPRLLWDDDDEELEAKRSAVKVAAAKKKNSALFDLEDDEKWITEIMKKIDALQLPGNALDMLIDELGGIDAVAEMTGRTSRMVRNYKDEFVLQKRTENGVSANEQNLYEREEFQAGRKLVAIISDAASSGISLHAENNDRVKNKRRRVHFTLELPWSADKTIQQMGRSHRSNQLVPPQYKLLVSPLGGERRFVAAVTKRLESLGALTQGDRRANAVTKGWDCFNVDTKEGAATVLDVYHFSNWSTKECLGQEDENDQKPLVNPPALGANERMALAKLCMENQSLIGAVEGIWRGNDGNVEALANEFNVLHAARLWLSLVGIDLEEYEKMSETAADKKTDIVSKFLNRILGLEIYRQQMLFDYFARYLQKTVESAIRDGTHARGVSTCGGRRVTFRDFKPLRLVTPTPTVKQLELLSVAVDQGFAYDDALAKLQEVTGDANISGDPVLAQNREFISTAQVGRFGSRDGFRLQRYDKKPILIIEVGTASLRGLSVQTDEFQVYHPDKLREPLTWQWKKVEYNYPTAVSPSQARVPWTRAFERRNLRAENYILTGPILYCWPFVLKCQYKEDIVMKKSIQLIRAIEKQEDGKETGQVAIGILLDTRKAPEIAKFVEQSNMTNEGIVRAMEIETNLIEDQKKQKRRRGYRTA